MPNALSGICGTVKSLAFHMPLWRFSALDPPTHNLIGAAIFGRWCSSVIRVGYRRAA